MKQNTKLNQHKRLGKVLIPPLKSLNMTEVSWINERLPDMLWAALIAKTYPRFRVLQIFRSVVDFLYTNKKTYKGVTHNELGMLSKRKRLAIIAHIISIHPSIKYVLAPLLVFEDLPGYSEWKKLLIEYPTDTWYHINSAISKALNHQCQMSTDIRWLKVVSKIALGQLHCGNEKLVESFNEIIEYPLRGDMHKVRPSIRSMELSYNLTETIKGQWAELFWKKCYTTKCINFAQPTNNEMVTDFQDAIKNKSILLDKIKKIQEQIITGCYETSTTSAIDAKHEASFGLMLYSTEVFNDLVMYETSKSITARLQLRTLCENLITFKYLISNEKGRTPLWAAYREHGNGELKLYAQKLEEGVNNISGITTKKIWSLANEDKSMEFVNINLGHWDSSNLRKMSEEAGCKDIYDKYYDYTSGFVHGNWGAIRMSVYTRCYSALHRYHRVPLFQHTLIENLTSEAISILNLMITELNLLYVLNIEKIEY